jgi:hypothetical protein
MVFFMFKISLFDFVTLTQVRREETLERRIERLLGGDAESPPIRYSLIRKRIAEYCFTGFNPEVLDALQKRVEDYVPTTKFQRDEKANCQMAIRLAQTMLRPVFPGISFERGETIDLHLGGVVIHVVTDAVLSWTDSDGVKHVGAIKSKIRKSDYPREYAEMAACLLVKAMRAKHPDAVVNPQRCFCFDVFRQRLVPANNLERNLDDALRVAEMFSPRGDIAA